MWDCTEPLSVTAAISKGSRVSLLARPQPPLNVLSRHRAHPWSQSHYSAMNHLTRRHKKYDTCHIAHSCIHKNISMRLVLYLLWHILCVTLMPASIRSLMHQVMLRCCLSQLNDADNKKSRASVGICAAYGTGRSYRSCSLRTALVGSGQYF